MSDYGAAAALARVVRDYGALIGDSPQQVHTMLTTSLGGDAAAARPWIDVLAHASALGIPRELIERAKPKSKAPATNDDLVQRLLARGVDPQLAAYAVGAWSMAVRPPTDAQPPAPAGPIPVPGAYPVGTPAGYPAGPGGPAIPAIGPSGPAPFPPGGPGGPAPAPNYPYAGQPGSQPPMGAPGASMPTQPVPTPTQPVPMPTSPLPLPGQQLPRRPGPGLPPGPGGYPSGPQFGGPQFPGGPQAPGGPGQLPPPWAPPGQGGPATPPGSKRPGVILGAAAAGLVVVAAGVYGFSAMRSGSDVADPAPTTSSSSTASSDAGALARVSGLSADVASAPGTIRLSWSAVAGASGYKICRDGGACLSVGGLTYTDTPGDGSQHNYVVYAVRGSEQGPPAALNATAGSTTASSAAPPPAAPVQALIDKIPSKWAQIDTCVDAGAAAPTVGVTCTGKSGGPATVKVMQFASAAEMKAAYTKDTAGLKSRNTCPAKSTWYFENTPNQDEGALACYTAGGSAVLVWSYNDSNVLVYASSPGTDMKALQTWWESLPLQLLS